MNKDLQSILNIIQRSEHLDDEEKNSLLKAANIVNKELEIESSLERVRTVAMSMNKPDDMLDVCRNISDQLELLNVKEIRNVQTAIFYKEKGTYMNYEYYAKHNKTFITETSYTNNKIHQEFADKMLKGNGEFMIAHIKGDEVKDWLAYQKTTNVFIDDHLNTASSLNYYWYSLGPVALGISTYSPLNDDETNLFKRFLKVFELSYRRYLDIEKAEEQARESQIQLALERIRARTMAMQKSDELAETASLLFKQLIGLGIKSTQMRTCAITTLRSDEPIGECWITKPDGDIIPRSFMVPYNETSAYKTIYAAWKNGEKFIVVNLSGDALVQHLNFLKKYAKIPTQQFQALPDQPTETFTHAMFFSQGYLFIISNEPLPEYHDIFKRFGAIFQQTYTRFLDLKKAEAQAKESQIQLALERVRARTMAMQKSDELSETVFILFQQFKELGENPDQATIGIIKEDEWVIEYWVTMYGNQMNRVFKFSIDEPNVTNKIYNSWKEQKKSLVIDLSGKELYDFATYRASMGGAAYNEKEKKRVINVAFFSKGILNVQSKESRSAESILLLERFAKVFEQTYTRFLDLKNAEAQAKESQIQLALERVRARTMAMQKSDELKEAAALLFQQVKSLGVPAYSCGYNIWEKTEKTFTSWMSSQDGSHINAVLNIPLTEDANFIRYVESKQKDEQFFVLELRGERMQEHYEYLKTIPAFKGYFDYAVSVGFDLPETQIHHLANFSQGNLLFITLEPCPQFHDVFKRFAKVFEQTYTRFLDLQKAEAQARDAKIEAALERVRSRSMAMQKSEELKEVIKIVYDQFIHLNINVDHAGFVVDYKLKSDWHFWIADKQDIPSKITTPYFDSAWGNDFNKTKEKGLDFFSTNLNFEEKNKFYTELLSYVPGLPEESKKFYLSCPGLAGSTVLFEDVSLYIENFSGIPYSDEENKILLRFGKVFQQTYTRFLDLQKAEAQGLEAVKRASVDRVRAEIASMRTTNDLEKITPLIWNELTVLGIPFVRCGVFIMDEEQQQVQTFLYTEGKAITSFTSTFSNSKIITEALPYWRRKEIYKTHWDETAFLEQAKALVEQGAVTTGEKYLTEHRPTDLYLHFLPFLQGMLYVGNAAPLSEEHLQLVQALADAFSTAYARYEDFNKLEAAKQQVDKTLVDLKQTQTQLIQSEKMASLGELTAGIAHEIQNPLNFVNNFSEVSNELIEELQEERNKAQGTRDEKMENEILNDIKQNLEKINHHGKRADAIVKGMLQHSRSTAGEKEPTDINALANEYLRLSYQGLRAKDKSFNSAIKTDFDTSIGKINIVPADIGRVLLNLYNNAFYAVNERRKAEGLGYEPAISVVTKKSENQIFIAVSDNGGGIPQKVVDKIFQPFFTTKPTGQGTGLGLSLSYDIIKAHGGEIKVETKEGEGTTFIIQIPTV